MQSVSSGHESVHFFSDRSVGLEAIVAIHSTRLGPALGGTRFYPYKNQDAALRDVLRLSEAMSLKSAAAGLSLGGGKSVILGDPATMKTPELLAAYGRSINRLGGAYVVAQDVGTTLEDIVQIGRETPHVAGRPIQMGGSGDPSVATASGVFSAMDATALALWGHGLKPGFRVSVQGVGKVGSALVEQLVSAGCEVVICDVDAKAVSEVALRYSVRVVPPTAILSQECEIVAPCAMGGILNASSIRSLRCRAVVGSANNQLRDPEDARRLATGGVVYVPDFIANAGGLINIAGESGRYCAEAAALQVQSIGATTKEILDFAKSSGQLPLVVATERALSRLGVGSPPE